MYSEGLDKEQIGGFYMYIEGHKKIFGQKGKKKCDEMKFAQVVQIDFESRQ